jgi:DNA modification methylase
MHIMNAIKADLAAITIKEMRTKFAGLATFPKPVLARVLSKLGYPADGPKEASAAQLLDNLTSIKIRLDQTKRIGMEGEVAWSLEWTFGHESDRLASIFRLVLHRMLSKGEVSNVRMAMIHMKFDQPDFDGVPLDRITVAQELLNIDNKQRSNFFPWNGQFSPQLIEILLRTYAPKQGLVLDPFAGSGTVLYEAAHLGLPTIGAEINPAACKMAQIYHLMNLSIVRRKSLANQLEKVLQDYLPDRAPSLFNTNGRATHKQIEESLIEIHGSLSDETARSLLEALIVLVDFYQEVSAEKVYGAWAKLKARVLSLPESDSLIRLVNCDARRLPLQDAEIDFVVTSPPYINVFNYHQQYRKSVEALGWNLLTVAQSEIGSNRKHRQNRFLTVIQYCLDMADALRELQRVCKDGSRIIVIVGRESNVRKTRFFNGEILAALASRSVGFSFTSRQERSFMNRFGERIFEDILHFTVRKGCNIRSEQPQSIAREVLEMARARAPEESLGDLEGALGLVDEVQMSPIYDREVARSRSSDRGKKEVKT